jgi:hypothetical protein
MAHAWSDIVDFYRERIEHQIGGMEPLLRLCEQIAASRYVVLAAHTSMFTLVIAQNQESLERHLELLRIGHTVDGRLRFRFREAPLQPLAWSRDCAGDEGFAVFERFVCDSRRWFRND